MFQKGNIWLRLFLTGVLCFFIYKEAGVLTAISIGLISLSLEMICFWMGQVNILLKQIADKQ